MNSQPRGVTNSDRFSLLMFCYATAAHTDALRRAEALQHVVDATQSATTSRDGQTVTVITGCKEWITAVAVAGEPRPEPPHLH